VRISDVSGLYHLHWKNEAAWIEVFVDEVLGAWQKGWWLKVPLWRDILVSSVLFHEMGHHIHATSRPEFRERETVAEEWRVRLSGRFFRSEYPWLVVLSYPVKAVRRLLRSMSRPRRSHKKKQ
jgi:hypothetical protein